MYDQNWYDQLVTLQDKVTICITPETDAAVCEDSYVYA